MELIMIGLSPTQKNIILQSKCVLLFLFCGLLLFNLFGCRIIRWNPRGDWEYKDLPGEYSLIRTNNKNIVLESSRWLPIPDRENAATKTRVATYISAICNNERYIAVRWTSPEEIDFDRIQEHDFSTAEYYLVDSTNDTLYGPFDTEKDFMQQCEELSVGNLTEWIDTLSMPSVLGDKYYDW